MRNRRARPRLGLAARGLRRCSRSCRSSNVSIPKLFDQPISTPGHARAARGVPRCSAALALTYDIQFGFTGLLSFGHALYIALGVYISNIAITDWHWSFWPSILFTIGVAFVRRECPRATSRLRVSGIAFAMVTLAFAQAGAVLALKDPHHWTHGEEGLGADYTKLPKAFVGIVNTKNLYWLALAFLAVVFFVVRWAVESSPGRVWQAIRENELRVEVLGLRPHAYKLQAFVLSSVLAAAGGIVYMLLYSGSTLARHAAELHADAAADGRDRRRRAHAGAPCSAASSTRTSTTG